MAGTDTATPQVVNYARPQKRARIVRPTARWVKQDTGARQDISLSHWQKPSDTARSFSSFDVKLEVPDFDEEVYDTHMTSESWTFEDTRHLVDLYRDCNGKWPIIIDRYDGPDRTMEDLKARFFQVSAAVMQVATPISSMTKTDYDLYEMLLKFNPAQETSRKRLAEGHMQRRQAEVDEETVLLSELQRIMHNQQLLDATRDELRERLDAPHATTNSYQYTTSQALTSLWQQLVAADRMRKGGRLRPIGPPLSTPADSQAPLRQRESLSGASAEPASSTIKLSEKEMLRYGVTNVSAGDKLPSGITFASDRLSKPRTAKSNLQTEKIAVILTAIGVTDLIPLPTTPVIDAFDKIMTKVHLLLDLRKLAEKEEQELKVREAEAAKLGV